MAPTKPLVEQQKAACLEIAGMPARDAIVLTGQAVKPDERQAAWRDKRLFFCTSQVRASPAVLAG